MSSVCPPLLVADHVTSHLEEIKNVMMFLLPQCKPVLVILRGQIYPGRGRSATLLCVGMNVYVCVLVIFMYPCSPRQSKDSRAVDMSLPNPLPTCCSNLRVSRPNTKPHTALL